MHNFTRSTAALVFVSALAGCAADGTLTGDMPTSSINQQQAKVDPVCPALVQHIEELRREGIADKIEKAANKKYKMTNADLIKADQLNKANGDFQARCAPKPVQATAQAPAQAASPIPPATTSPAAAAQ